MKNILTGYKSCGREYIYYIQICLSMRLSPVFLLCYFLTDIIVPPFCVFLYLNLCNYVRISDKRDHCHLNVYRLLFIRI
jgi:hypothetical protein